MKLRFKNQQFQADAANAVCNVFVGQPFRTPTYMMDPGNAPGQLTHINDATGFGNAPIVIDDDKVLYNIRNIQRKGQIEPSVNLAGRFNLTIEMETGVGKTYTYIKTMYELNKRYGWSKFIIAVPSVAIREGVYKSFQMTEEHFRAISGKNVVYDVVDSYDKLWELVQG